MAAANEGPLRRWPSVPELPADAFKGTAGYYADYRPPYPTDLLAHLLRRAGHGRNARLLDLGCGPGRVALSLARHYGEVWAVDPEPEMLEEGGRRTPNELEHRVHWVQSTAEALEIDNGGFQLATIGEAFHRMDQRRVATLVRGWLADDGCVAILGYRHMWHGIEMWKQRVCEVLKGYRESGAAPSREKSRQDGVMSFEDVLRATGFRSIQSREFRETRKWSADEVVGYLYSVSVCSMRVLDDRASEFERDVRRALREADPGGRYPETATFECLSALK